jgi:hypothetical protein
MSSEQIKFQLVVYRRSVEVSVPRRPSAAARRGRTTLGGITSRPAQASTFVLLRSPVLTAVLLSSLSFLAFPGTATSLVILRNEN